MAGSDTVRSRVVVSGRVQGVSFRAMCRHEAGLVGASGWVRNLADGRVEAVFEGAPDGVAHMVRWCDQGPTWARVDAVEIYDEEPLGELGFEVR